MVTLEDILEQVVGQIEDEYPHEAPVSLRDAVANGGIELDLIAASGAEAIRALARSIPNKKLPPGLEPGYIERVALEREGQFSTDLGNGVAIPHARCPGLAAPIVVFGRSREGMVFSSNSSDLVHLVFLLVTPSEQPETQLALLKQLAGLCREASDRDALMRISAPGALLAFLESAARASPSGTHESSSRTIRSE